MADRSYLSIGEVLSLLRDEFPDITISKIRFLESQGLLDPERTPSGYRKFYEADVERLRWILRQQREHFLPLKVIRGRLLGEPADESDGMVPDQAQEETRPRAPAKTAGRSAPGGPATPAPVSPAAASDRAPAAGPTPPAAAAAPALSAGMSAVSLTFDELASASGLPMERLRELERAGFFAGRPVAGSVYYDEEALVVAKLAAGFSNFGIEIRHLRIYKNAAEREAGLFEQVVTPLLKQRNPQARKEAVEALQELTQLGQGLRSAMLRQTLRAITGG
jgi:DNA-binding transcriptional MerR regulator